MPTYRYQARNAEGELQTGHLQADSQEDAARVLMENGETPITFHEVRDASGKSFLNVTLWDKPVSPSELSGFCRQVHTLLQAGIPVSSALKHILLTTRTPLLKKALVALQYDLAAGRSLSQAMRQQPKVFSDVMVNMVVVGEKTGDLARSFEQLSAYLELSARTAKEIAQTSRYPITVIITVLAALVIMNFLVIPSFAKLFSRMGENMPVITKGLIGMSNFFHAHGVTLLIVLVLVVVGMVVLRRTSEGQRLWDLVKFRVPLIGRIFLQIGLARFTWTLSMMLKSGMGLDQALALVSKTVGNSYLGDCIIKLKAGVERGDTLANTMRVVPIFPSMLVEVAQIGEESGALDVMMMQTAQYFDEEVAYGIKRFQDLLQPTLLFIIGGLVLLLALGIFLPMWDMMSAFGG